MGRWEDPSLDAHRERVRYDDYRCSVPGRSGLEGATVRWHGHTNQPEADTAPASVNEASDDGLLWGGLIAYKPAYTTSAREGSSGARPSGRAPRRRMPAKQGVVGRDPPIRRRRRWTPERRNYETRTTSESWAGPEADWVGSALARRFGWHVAEQAALEVDRVIRLGRPVQNPRGLGLPFCPLFRPTPPMPPTAPRRLRQHATQPIPGTPPRRRPQHPNPRQRRSNSSNTSPEPGYRT